MSTRGQGLNLPVEVLSQPGTPRKAILAASTGGHLAQLVRFAMNWNLDPESLWVTFDSPQSRSMLAGRRVMYVPYIRPRDVARVLNAATLISRKLTEERFDIAVSTGAGIALSLLPAARLRGVPGTYIESVSRVNGPSMTGRLIRASGTAKLRTQHANWADRRWQKHPSVLATFVARERARPSDESPSIFVTLGTIKPYRFDSLIDAVLGTGLAGPKTVWQVGETNRVELPGTVVDQTSAEEFRRYATESDIVITHAGVGTILNLLDWGVFPVVVPRRRERGEHVDNHQLQIAALLGSLDIATVTDSNEMEREQVLSAMFREIVTAANTTV